MESIKKIKIFQNSNWMRSSYYKFFFWGSSYYKSKNSINCEMLTKQYKENHKKKQRFSTDDTWEWISQILAKCGLTLRYLSRRAIDLSCFPCNDITKLFRYVSLSISLGSVDRYSLSLSPQFVIH